MPGLLMSIGVGVVLIAVLALGLGNWGAALWIGVPMAASTLLGYKVRVGPAIIILLLAILSISMILGLMTLNLAGVFCAMTMVAISFPPLTIGVALGAALRVGLKSTSFSQRWHLPAIIIVALALLGGLIEGRPRQDRPLETIATTGLINAPIEQVWHSLMFYEQVTHEPPWILKVGLARPTSTSGISRNVGDEKVCLYNKGRITKRVTAVNQPHELAFDVIEQQIGYEHDVRLDSGRFALRADSPHLAVLTLETTYRPLLSPRWIWRPFERYAVHTLHEHVLEGIDLESRRTWDADQYSAASLQVRPPRVASDSSKGPHADRH